MRNTEGGPSSSDGTGSSGAASSTSGSTSSPVTGNAGCEQPWGDPVVYYRFDECTHQVADLMRSGLDATLVAGRCEFGGDLGEALGGIWSSGGALACPRGEVGCARVDVGDPPATTFLTLSLWVKAIDWAHCPTEHGECWILTREDDEPSEGYRLLSDGGTYTFSIGGTAAQARGPAVVPNGRWHHVVATYDGTEATVYIDGVPGPSRALSGETASGEPLWIGGPTMGPVREPAHPDDVQIDEVLVWDEALTPAEVNALHYRYRNCGRPTI